MQGVQGLLLTADSFIGKADAWVLVIIEAPCDVREMREDNEKTWKGGTIEKSGFVFLPDYISLWVVFEQ